MKLLIDCNEVFDILTRGPFPSGGEHDQAVEHHLRSCHDCRQLAEALRPAVELFHESLTAQEATNLPEYHGRVAPLDQPVFRSLPRDISEVRYESAAHDRSFAPRRPVREPVRGSRAALLMQGLIGMALTAAIVLTVISLGASVRNMTRSPGRSSNQGLVAQPVVSGAEAARRLLSLQLPGECLLDKLRETASSGRSLEQQIAQAWEERKLDCCTHCHDSNQPRLKSGLLVATLVSNCAICHKG
jgi:hypothetical protein